MHNRQNALSKWLEGILGLSQFSLTPLTGDASFRRYFRLHYSGISRIVMDAPPEKEPLGSFIAIATLLRANGILAPEIHASDEKQGFLILDDFGDCLLLNKISSESVDKLYQSAITTLITLQQCPASSYAFPHFDKKFILQELHLFNEWFLNAYLKISLTASEERLIEETFDWLSNEVAGQPKVVIHRDYHSRNIMVTDNRHDSRLAIIDFQDAMQGPLTYDLVSLLKDCYIQWPRETVIRWLTFFYENSPQAKDYSQLSFVRAFDLCGLQRHIKVLGIFSRLYLRDNKPNYLKDLPLTLHYVLACLESYSELQPFYQFMQRRIQLP
ncbi:MAG: phosphotransferase [Legionella sp.]|nr:phosphotransferase [Legionella sp.]